MSTSSYAAPPLRPVDPIHPLVFNREASSASSSSLSSLSTGTLALSPSKHFSPLTHAPHLLPEAATPAKPTQQGGFVHQESYPSPISLMSATPAASESQFSTPALASGVSGFFKAGAGSSRDPSLQPNLPGPGPAPRKSSTQKRSKAGFTCLGCRRRKYRSVSSRCQLLSLNNSVTIVRALTWSDRCNGARPNCDQCIKSSIPCIYSEQAADDSPSPRTFTSPAPSTSTTIGKRQRPSSSGSSATNPDKKAKPGLKKAVWPELVPKMDASLSQVSLIRVYRVCLLRRILFVEDILRAVRSKARSRRSTSFT